jgi:hypothetical protein
VYQTYQQAVKHQQTVNMLSRLNQAVIGSRINPQSAKPKSAPWFEGWYTRVIGPEHSFGLVTGYFPEQSPKHPAFYTGLLFNEDSKLGKLQAFESYVDSSEGIRVHRGPEAEPNLAGATEAPDFCVEVGAPAAVAAVAWMLCQRKLPHSTLSGRSNRYLLHDTYLQRCCLVSLAGYSDRRRAIPSAAKL